MVDEILWIKPTHFVINGPKFAGLVDVDLASLLGVSLAELFANFQSFDASLENATLAAEVGRARKTKRAGQWNLGLVK